MKISEKAFLKFVVACLRTGNKQLAKKMIKQQDKGKGKEKK